MTYQTYLARTQATWQASQEQELRERARTIPALWDYKSASGLCWESTYVVAAELERAGVLNDPRLAYQDGFFLFDGRGGRTYFTY